MVFVTRGWCRPVRRLRKGSETRPGETSQFEGTIFTPSRTVHVFRRSGPTPTRLAPQHLPSLAMDFMMQRRNIMNCLQNSNSSVKAGSAPVVSRRAALAVYTAGNFFQMADEAADMLKRRAVLVVEGKDAQNPPAEGLPQT